MNDYLLFRANPFAPKLHLLYGEVFPVSLLVLVKGGGKASSCSNMALYLLS